MAAMITLPTRVDRLEDLMAELTYNVNRVTLDIDALREEMRDFKDEMGDFKDETRRESRAFKDEMRAFKDEMSAFKDEMRAFKDEMRVFREESNEDTRAMHRSIAEVSRKMGTMAEDLVAPSVPRILNQMVKCSTEPQMLGVRIRKRLPDGRSREYDVIAVCDDILLINETKSYLRPEDVPDFARKLETAREFLPEYAANRIVGALATFYMDPSLVTYGERQGLIMMGVVDGLMEILNQEGFIPRAY